MAEQPDSDSPEKSGSPAEEPQILFPIKKILTSAGFPR